MQRLVVRRREEIAKKCGKATFLEIDVSDNDSVTNAAREFSNMEGCLDVLVNNAGIIVDGDNAVLEMSDDLFLGRKGRTVSRAPQDLTGKFLRDRKRFRGDPPLPEGYGGAGPAFFTPAKKGFLGVLG